MEYVVDYCSDTEFKAERNQKIGILGGTFNPVHLGHVEIAEKLRDEFALKSVLMLPTGNPPHKYNGILPKEYRLDMLKLSCENIPHIHVCEMECERTGVTYTVDTLLSLAKKAITYYYIIGSDTLFDLETWKDLQNVFKLTDFICVRRDNTSLSAITEEIKRLNKAYNANILLSDFAGPDISSTLVRKSVAAGKSISGMVDKKVEEYIAANGLYK